MTPDELKSLTVLMVDDDEMSRDFNLHVLGRLGITKVLVAEDASTGRALVDAHMPDFALLDIYMPDGDGWDLLKHIRRASPKTLVIMVTGTNRPADFDQSLASFADGFCIKPVLPDVLKKAMINARNSRK